jgi:hypothetical protein
MEKLNNDEVSLERGTEEKLISSQQRLLAHSLAKEPFLKQRNEGK